jgi:hypothetical protein
MHRRQAKLMTTALMQAYAYIPIYLYALPAFQHLAGDRDHNLTSPPARPSKKIQSLSTQTQNDSSIFGCLFSTNKTAHETLRHNQWRFVFRCRLHHQIELKDATVRWGSFVSQPSGWGHAPSNQREADGRRHHPVAVPISTCFCGRHHPMGVLDAINRWGSTCVASVRMGTHRFSSQESN